MIIAVASGKGGTGKTTVAVNLALAASRPVHLLDCDVEEPNCQIFLKARIALRETVCLLVPSVDDTRCTSCGECGRVCQYHAIVSLAAKPLVFPELCHGCGGCVKACPTGAISEVEREIGVVEAGTRRNMEFTQGRLRVGQPTSPPLIRAVKKRASREALTIVDCPPGTSCPVVAAVRDSDFVVLVTEPTPFGLNDLRLAIEVVGKLGMPFGVVVNRAGIGDDGVYVFCERRNTPVILTIPDDRRIAEAYSRGVPVVEALPEYRHLFKGLLEKLEKGAGA